MYVGNRVFVTVLLHCDFDPTNVNFQAIFSIQDVTINQSITLQASSPYKKISGGIRREVRFLVLITSYLNRRILLQIYF